MPTQHTVACLIALYAASRRCDGQLLNSNSSWTARQENNKIATFLLVYLISILGPWASRFPPDLDYRCKETIGFTHVHYDNEKYVHHQHERQVDSFNCENIIEKVEIYHQMRAKDKKGKLVANTASPIDRDDATREQINSAPRHAHIVKMCVVLETTLPSVRKTLHLLHIIFMIIIFYDLKSFLFV